MRKPLLLATFGLITLAACGGSPQAAATAVPSATTGAAPETIRLTDFALTPNDVTVPRGGAILVENAGQAPHNLYVRDASGKVLAHTANLQPGEHATLQVDLAPGTYVDFCQEPGHESLGMKGSLKVT